MPFRYAHAPINEALIDIRVQRRPDLTVRDIENIGPLVGPAYTIRETLYSFEQHISGGAEFEASSKQAITGYRYSTADGKQVFQARLDGFTFSRLRPYWDWTELKREAQRLWEIYHSSLRPEKVTRLAVRYINQIDIPEANVDLDEYFRTGPKISDALPQVIDQFMMQMFLAQRDFGGTLALTLALAPPKGPSTTSIILDIDVFKEQAVNATDEVPWELFELLRERKNTFFEGCITDKARALFGERTEY